MNTVKLTKAIVLGRLVVMNSYKSELFDFMDVYSKKTDISYRLDFNLNNVVKISNGEHNPIDYADYDYDGDNCDLESLLQDALDKNICTMTFDEFLEVI